MGFWRIIEPEATTNLITNPSFETGTTGWAATGSNTIAQSTTVSWIGANSLKCTYQDSAELASYSVTLTAAAHSFSLWVYVDSGYGGSDLKVDFNGFTSITGETEGDVDMTLTNQWQRVTAFGTPDAGDLAGEVRIYENGSGQSASEFIYIDAAQLEALDHATTYVDGSLDHGEWVGQAHASKSKRGAQSRMGGRERDLDDYNLYIREWPGLGMASVRQREHEYSLKPGSEYEGWHEPPREFTLIGEFTGSTFAGLHSDRNDVLNLIKPDDVSGAQPFLLRYYGSDTDQPMEIGCVYDRGMEIASPFRGFNEQVALTLRSHDPFWNELGWNTTVLDLGDSATYYSVAAKLRDNEQWSNLSASAISGNKNVWVIKRSPIDGKVFVGGDFTAFDGDTGADHLVYYDPTDSTWNKVGSDNDFSDYVRALEFHPDGTLYIGGNFTDAGGDTDADYLAQYDGTTVSSVSGGGTGPVFALAYDNDYTLWIGGNFTNWDTDKGSNLTTWTGSAYADPGGTHDLAVQAIAVDNDNNVYVGGQFSTTNNYIDYYDGTAWNAMGTGMNGIVAGLAVAENGDIYAGGTFTTSGGVTTNRIARWNGSGWYALGDGFSDNYVYKLTFAPDGLLYMVGTFTDEPFNGFAVWNGSSFVHSDIDIASGDGYLSTEIGSEDPSNEKIYDVWAGLDDQGSAGIGGLTTVTNNGTARVFPQIVIENDGATTVTLLWIRNETTGATLWFDYDLQDGEIVTIDCHEQTITSNYAGNIRHELKRNSDFADFYLLPGANSITAYTEDTGTNSGTSYITFRNPFWSADGKA